MVSNIQKKTKYALYTHTHIAQLYPQTLRIIYGSGGSSNKK